MGVSFLSRRLWRPILLMVLAGILALLALDRFTGFTARRIQERRNAAIKAAVAEGDGIQDPAEAIRRYLAIEPRLPEIRVRILRRRWVEAVRKIQRFRKARRHPVLGAQAAEFDRDLRRHLAEMTARCDDALAGSGPPPALAWRFHNLRGMARVMEAFSITW